MGLAFPRRRRDREPVGEHDVVPGGLRRWYLTHEYAVVYVVAGTCYVLVGIRVPFVLNWIVGPLWPVVCMWVGPVLVRRVTGWTDALP